VKKVTNNLGVKKMIGYFLPGIILLGIMTSIEDIKQGKIRNKWIITALAYSIIVYAGLISFYLLGDGIEVSYIVELITNFLFAIAIGFGFWYMKIWTAGDGKLFIGFAALIPLTMFSLGHQKWMPSLTLLFNIFIPALAIMTVLILFKIKIKDLKEVITDFIKEFFQPKELVKQLISFFAILWVVSILLSFGEMGNNPMLRVGLTMILFGGIQKKFGDKSVYIMGVVSLARLIFDKSIYSASFLIDLLVLVFVWRLIRSFLRGSLSKLGKKVFSEEINVKNLKQGMILAEAVLKKDIISKQELKIWKNYPGVKVVKKGKTYYILRPKSHGGSQSFIEEEAEGLTACQINKLRKTGIKKIMIGQTIPFGPFMFLGVILTLIAKGNILIFVRNLVSGG